MARNSKRRYKKNSITKIDYFTLVFNTMQRKIENFQFYKNFDSFWPISNLLTRANQKGLYFFEPFFHKVFSGMSLICALSRPKKLILFTEFVKFFLINFCFWHILSIKHDPNDVYSSRIIQILHIRL